YSEIDPGNWKSGDNTQTKVTVKPTYYKLVMDGQEIIEIDIVNMVEKVDGKDLLQAQRDALGL
ncbi:TPA: phage major tail tube protein, partial [Proteus mirabilis]